MDFVSFRIFLCVCMYFYQKDPFYCIHLGIFNLFESKVKSNSKAEKCYLKWEWNEANNILCVFVCVLFPENDMC